MDAAWTLEVRWAGLSLAAVGFIAYLWLRHRRRGAVALLIFMAALILGIGGYALALASTTMATRPMWIQLQLLSGLCGVVAVAAVRLGAVSPARATSVARAVLQGQQRPAPVPVVSRRGTTGRRATEFPPADLGPRYQSLFLEHPDALFWLDLEGCIQAANPASARLTGYGVDELLNRSLLLIIEPESTDRSVRACVAATRGQARRVEVAISHKRGCRIHVVLSYLPIVVDGRIVGVHCLAKDLTDRKRLERQLRERAFRDPLTGLPTQACFLRQVRRALERGGPREAPVAILLLDLAHLGRINAGLGRAVGDHLLRTVACRLTACLPDGGYVARLGGDQFAILLEEVADENAVSAVAARVRHALEAPIPAGWRELQLGVCIGIALGHGLDERPERLLQAADAALTQARACSGRAYAVADRATASLVRERLDLEYQLRRAVEHGQLHLRYQPVVELATGRLTAVEALLRWDHPQHGVVEPGHFIPIAEGSGLIVPMGEWVLGEACRQLRAWQDRYPAAASLEVSVNVSARQLEQRDLVGTVARCLRDAGLAASSLTLEITETAALKPDAAVAEALGALRDRGVQLVLDDFGVGYSSLGHLRLPVSGLKLDQAFVRGLGRDPRIEVLIGALVTAARALGLRVTAEGVETADQLSRVRRLGCDRAQGYYFGRPMPAAELETLLERVRPRWSREQPLSAADREAMMAQLRC